MGAPFDLPAIDDRTCRSDLHGTPVSAVVVGTFDCSSLNGRDPDSAYCLRCAVMLHDVGYLTPADPTCQIPTVEQFLAWRDRGESDANRQPR